MKLQETFIYKGVKRVCVGKPIYPCASIQFIEYVDYGIPLHKQARVRIYLSELERDREDARIGIVKVTDTAVAGEALYSPAIYTLNDEGDVLNIQLVVNK